MSNDKQNLAVINPEMTVAIETHGEHVTSAMVADIEGRFLASKKYHQNQKQELTKQREELQKQIDTSVEQAANDDAKKPQSILDGLEAMGYGSPRFNITGQILRTSSISYEVSIVVDKEKGQWILFSQSNEAKTPDAVLDLVKQKDEINSQISSMNEILAEIGRNLQNMDRFERAARGAMARSMLANSGETGRAMLDQMSEFMPSDISHLLLPNGDSSAD